MSIAFIILSHGDVGGLLRLTRKLHTMFDQPQIICHQDPVDQINAVNWPAGVNIIDPPLKTKWGRWSLVEAMLQCLQQLVKTEDWKQFVFLSSADYPVKPASEILRVLSAEEVDCFIDYRPLVPLAGDRHAVEADPCFTALYDVDRTSVYRRRYNHLQIPVPQAIAQSRARAAGRPQDWDEYVSFRIPVASQGVFDRNYRPFIGSQWIMGNRRVARVLTEPNDKDLKLRRYLKHRWVPDEIYCQTVLCNRQDLKLYANPLRFTAWGDSFERPRILTDDDIPLIQHSKALFARKFAPGPVSDAFDALIL